MNASQETKQLESFFESYARAFEALDAHRIAEFDGLPCLSLRGDGSMRRP